MTEPHLLAMQWDRLFECASDDPSNYSWSTRDAEGSDDLVVDIATWHPVKRADQPKRARPTTRARFRRRNSGITLWDSGTLRAPAATDAALDRALAAQFELDRVTAERRRK